MRPEARRLARLFRTPRRRIALATASVLTATLLQGVTAPAVAEGWHRPALPASEPPVAGGPAGKALPRKVMKTPRTPQQPPATAWPKPGAATVTLGSKPARAKGLPLTLAARGATAKGASGKVAARVLDRAFARKAGLNGPVFTLRAGSAKDAGRVRAGLDYSSFAGAYGGGYADRLRLVELPACVLTSPQKPQCRTTEPVDTVNDPETRTLTAKAVTLSASSATVLAAVAGSSSGLGDYKATSLSASATWSTDLNSGSFAWSYPLAVPQVPGGLVPNLSLSYSSGAVDGRTGNTNNQSSWVGDGFDLSPGYIERRYKGCSDDDVKNADGNVPGDPCWGYDNAVLQLNGTGGELVPSGTNTWKLKDDDGTKVERIYGSTSDVRSNGARNDEYWRVTTPDGTQYYFGYNRLPGWAGGNATTDSTWTVPVYGDDSGEPCHAAAFADSWCQQGWRWNLDYVVDTHGNAAAYYYYDKETNSYGRNLKPADDTPYVRGGTLDHIEYGLKSTSVYSAKALAKVDFTSSERCIPDSSTDCSSISKDAFYWYDTPWDLNCDAGTDCDKGRVSPAFFTRKRLTDVTTEVLASGSYSKVDDWKLTHRWGQADIDYQLLLDSIQRIGHDGTSSVTLPKVTFAYTQLANRLDKTGDGWAPFIKARLSTIDDESGGQIDVGYSAPACDFDALPTPETNTTRCFPQYIGGDATTDPERQWFNKYVVSTVTSTDRTGGAPDQVTMYDYLDGAAWHYDDTDGMTKDKFKTWSDWRGYGHVRVRTGGQGGAAAMKTQTDSYFLRGMDGDRKNTSGGTKDVSVTLDPGEGDPITDHASTAGFGYKTVTYSGPDGKVLAKTVNRPWHNETAKKVRDWGTVTADLTGTENVRTWTSLDDGAGAKWRTTSLTNTLDPATGLITRIDDAGDTSTTDDDQCTRSTYVAGTVRSTDSFTYDDIGDTHTRLLGDGTSQTLDWDAEGHLAKVTQPVAGGSDKVTEYLYDADGDRLIGRTPTETTLYLGGTEITLAKGASAAKGTRYFDLGGGHQAVQQDDGTISFTLADHHGTAQLSVNADTQALTQRRTEPFGDTRGTVPGSWPGTKGFVGGTTDTATGLTHLGAREYDPATGRFLSVDPVFTATDPQQMHGYTYADNNPLTYSDPAGTEIGSKPNSCQYDLKYCSKHEQQEVGYDPKTGTSDYHRGNIYKRAHARQKAWTADNTPVTNDIDKLQNYWASMMDGEFTDDFWDNPVYESKKAGSACYGREGCRQAYLYVLHNGDDADVATAKEIAATYCVYNAQQCADEDKEVARGKVIEGMVDDALLAYIGGAAGAERPRPCNSFVPGTEVLMADGSTKPIEDVRTGDKVLATDPETGRTEVKTVTAEITGKGLKHLVRITLTVKDKKGAKHTVSVTATDGHPFWVAELHRWIDAGDLRTAERLTTAAGAEVSITAVHRWTRPATVHNITVADLHTYYVLAGGTSVLVHNAGLCPEGAASVWDRGSFETLERSFDYHWQKHAEPLNISREQYLRDSKEWAEQLAQPGGKKGYDARGQRDEDGNWAVKYSDPGGGKGGIVAPDGKVLSFWYTDAH
ncbi:polymorphic toxin-type HINT domain-containing protein [Streptomyces sp. NPDC059629]|uniref:polymorphic toxin-type HINT domain-containing protein n=1 Tax=Streptomyces sp. NPDC059629 TaxID=3346889 RepID=UPI0036B2305F